MKKSFFVMMAYVLSVGALADEPPGGIVTLCNTKAEVAFSPNGDALRNIVHAIDAADTTIHVQAYSFTQEDIAGALKDAHSRGVDVEIILDAGQTTAPYSAIDEVYGHGIDVLIDDDVAIAHNKVMIIDGRTVVTGSFNFSQSAQQRNAENLLVVHSYGLAHMYENNYQWRRSYSEPYDP